MAQPPTRDINTKLHSPITKLGTTQLKHITRLRNTVKNMNLKPKTDTPTLTDPQHTKQTQTQASEILQLPDSPNVEGIPALCNKAIATIMTKANRELMESLSGKRKTNYIKRALNTTIITSRPHRAYSPTPKNNPNLMPYGTQTPKK